LASRDEFDNHLQQILRAAEFNNSEHALIYLQLEQYDTINTDYGQVAGEELLRQISRVILQQIRKRDTLARIDRAAFGVVMEECALSQANKVANNLAKAIENYRFIWQGSGSKINFNIGLVPVTNSHSNLSRILEAAVSACHEAKRTGSNTVHILQPDAELAGQHQAMQWLSHVQQALEHDRLALAFQKIVNVSDSDAGSRSTFGCELLLRMKDEQGNEIAPSNYLPAVEHYNLSAQLDRWVVASTLEWLHRQSQQLNQIRVCAINLSAGSLDDEAFLDFLLRRFDSSKTLPRKICFEIKEETALSRLGSVNLFIRTLKDRGCRFLLDDFGTGWSSFTYLKNMPVDFLKINSALLNGIATDQVDHAIVKSIVEVGHAMGKKVFAAGIESEEIFAKLAALGIDYAQGHYIASPQPLAGLQQD
jgi:diguanylate cyclase (GGDEF)-like protein